jgi:hypothetical protein
MERRFISKLCALIHPVHTGRGSSYLCDLVSLTSDIASRSRLCSASSQRYELPASRINTSEGVTRLPALRPETPCLRLRM